MSAARSEASGSWRDLIGRTWERNVLFSVLLELTYRCNLNCAFCYNDLSLEGMPLSRERYFRLFDELREMGVLNLILSGGEPLAHPDFFALGSRARELGFVVRVKSNGHALGPERARRLLDEVDPFLVEVSLHGARAETHDRQTRVPGSFDRLLENLRGLIRLGGRVKINSTLTRWNAAEVEAMYDLADDLGAPLQFDPQVTPRDDGDPEPLALQPDREQVAALFRIQARRAARRSAAPSGQGPPVPAVAREGDQLAAGASAAGVGAAGASPFAGGKHCGAGSSSVAVDPYGNVYPCVQWRRPVGNLHEASLADLWGGSAVLAEVRSEVVEVGEKVARLGSAGAGMGFCPGLAESLTGSATELYDGARERRGLRAEEESGKEAPRGPLLPVIS